MPQDFEVGEIVTLVYHGTLRTGKVETIRPTCITLELFGGDGGYKNFCYNKMSEVEHLA